MKAENLEAIRQAGGGRESGDGAPNGMNINGALNVLESAAEKMADYDADEIEDLGPEWQEKVEDAFEDFQYHFSALDNCFADCVADEDDAFEMEIQVGTEEEEVGEDEDGEPIYEEYPVFETKSIENPHGKTPLDDEDAPRPKPPAQNGGD